MEHGPVPPHERSWRHPSELAEAERAEWRDEPVPHSTRVFALTTGTVGLIAIALLVLTVTPSRSSSPIAVSASTTIAAADLAPSAPTIAAVRRTGSGEVGSAGTGTTVHALATPIGRGDYAVISRVSLDGIASSTVSVQLPSGRLTSGRVIDSTSGAVLVELEDAEAGHDVSGHRPRDREVVTVMASPPITIAYADIASLVVEEGTAIIDDEGDLVGLCSDDGDGTKVVEIDPAMTDDMTADDDTATDD